ncbi:GNAT family N-acetyltransferase [Actinomadura hibisca]|uniref:GNAT family N-acetyltransferase n=1 Tax=Actinomadura hibisca TaxID=68565 RepID=UPI000832B785|nr:GNAT family N-acetyltransferase [Actinomadura hibisca]
MRDLILTSHTGEHAHRIAPAVLDLYNEVYDVPPYQSDPFFSPEIAAIRLDKALGMKGFQVITAHHGQELAGFVYGVTLLADAPWWDSLQVDADLRARVDEEEIAWLRELAVRAPWRSAGIGRALHDRFVSDRTTVYNQPWTALTCIIDNEPAHSAYRKWGYQIIGKIKHAPESPVYDAMLLPPSAATRL